MSDSRTDDTVEIPAFDLNEASRYPRTGSSQVKVDLAAATNQGRVRPRNEDHYAVFRFGRTLETLFTNLPEDQIPKLSDETGYLMIVADGIGGVAGGKEASELAISLLHSLLLDTPDWILTTGARETERVLKRTEERYQRIDAALRYLGNSDPGLKGMGTTMTLAVSLGSNLIIGHIGDSRAYLYRAGKLLQLTRDHNLVQVLLAAGVIEPEEAATHPLRHMLMQSLGAGASALGDFFRATIADDDQLLLCTDGLTDMVDNGTIALILAHANTAQDACSKLIEQALANGGKDNVTVALARYKFPQEPRAGEKDSGHG
jgi:protein phosphatase